MITDLCVATYVLLNIYPSINDKFVTARFYIRYEIYGNRSDNFFNTGIYINMDEFRILLSYMIRYLTNKCKLISNPLNIIHNYTTV